MHLASTLGRPFPSGCHAIRTKMGALEAKGHFPGSFSHVPGKWGQTHVPTLPWGNGVAVFWAPWGGATRQGD